VVQKWCHFIKAAQKWCHFFYQSGAEVVPFYQSGAEVVSAILSKRRRSSKCHFIEVAQK
jgi:hypothetical protein